MAFDTALFRHVSYLWDEKKAIAMAGDDVALLLYRSNLLGSDFRLTNYGGGNTSCKATAPDPVTNEPTEVMWIKGSGGDLSTLTKKDLAVLYMSRLQGLKNIYKSLQDEDRIAGLFNYCLFDRESKAPSIDTALWTSCVNRRREETS
jgi:rhamnose utilization protein RhaD (predicted bifunctional aldolase and dehydrogenase)